MSSYWIPKNLPEPTEEYQKSQEKKSYLLSTKEKRIHPKWIYDNGAYVDDEYLFRNEGWLLISNFDEMPISDDNFYYVEELPDNWEISEDGKSIKMVWKKYTIVDPIFENEEIFKLKVAKPFDTWIFDDSNMTLERQYHTETYTNEELTQRKWNLLRSTRNNSLVLTDWIIIKSIEKNQTVPQEILDYRQKLRDLPANIDDISIYSYDDIMQLKLLPEIPQSIINHAS